VQPEVFQDLLQQIINGLTVGTAYSLVALGFTMVYGIVRLMNFAHGDIYMIAAFAAVTLLWSTSLPIFLVVPMAIIAAIVVALTMARFAYKPLFSAPRISLFLTTIGASIFLEYGAMQIWSPKTHAFPYVFANPIFLIGGARVSLLQIIMIVISVLLMAGLTLFVKKTKLGKAMKASSHNMNVARLMGINVDAVVYITFIIGSLLAAVAGLLIAVYYNAVYPLMGFKICLIAFASSVLGGIGIIPGAMLGGLIMGVTESLGAAYISSSFRDGFAFAVVIIFLLLRPAGILGRHVPEKI
jgi:branched-chain amino acid transport system permease protein